MKILFLDIDGVINSTRTLLAFDAYPHNFDGSDAELFDWVAVGLIRKLCEKTGAKICLSSSWRLYFSPKECAEALNLPIIDKTGDHSTRGLEINAWLADHPEVETSAIVDDFDQFLESQQSRFVKTDEDEGLSYRNYKELVRILGA